MQAGVVSHRQLRALGHSPQAIERRVCTGQLHPLHRGVYAVGHRLVNVEGRRRAAVMALGDDAFFSHQSAAAESGFTDLGRCPTTRS